MNLPASASSILARLALAAASLMLFVVVSSAYLRLVAAGLGCEPWPDCYGAPPMPGVHPGDGAAQPLLFLARLGHRLAASAMLLLVFAILVASLRRPLRRGDVVLAWAMAALTAFLALLGISSSTGTAPALALGNLLGGFALLACAWGLRARQGHPLRFEITRSRPVPSLRFATVAAVVLLAVQIGLGGLVSIKLAAVACPTLPGCEGDFSPGEKLAAFDPFASSPAPLPRDQGAALHLIHRLGALLILGWLGAVTVGVWAYPGLRGPAAAAFLLALLQAVLGAAMVQLAFPLSLALTHNVLAAALLLATVELAVRTARRRRAAPLA
jgi:cytochrome c oxidase assembly protein subunit 15